MKNLLSLLLLASIITSCGTAKKVSATAARTSKADRIIAQAQAFIGTPYKWGGTSRSGMDCSGLVYTAFQKEQISLPRVSRDMAQKGKPISLKEVIAGDLLFFKTDKNSRKINHVGLVTAVKGGVIYFIHATSSRGVLTSSLEEKYWKARFSQARHIL